MHRVINDAKKGRFNVHWEPYITACGYCSYNYTYISKIETFKEDRNKILKIIKAPKLDDNDPHGNFKAGEHIGDLTKKYFSEISKEEAQILYEIYQVDFEMFDYDPKLYIEIIE